MIIYNVVSWLVSGAPPNKFLSLFSVEIFNYPGLKTVKSKQIQSISIYF